MSILKFLTSKTFLKQILLAVVTVAVVCFIILKWLNVSTNHGKFETVPNLIGKSINLSKMALKDNNLMMQIQDSANYNPNYKIFSVVEQEPLAGEKVKNGRKVYVTLNPSGYRKIPVPDLMEHTFRQAKPTLEALGFKVGKITYKNNIGKDLVLKMKYKGKTISEGDMLPKTSAIDLILGNGKRL